MQLKQLEYYIDLCQTLNFTKTANNFYISQTAITKQIQNLEKELGFHLFKRNNKTVEMTKQSMLFLPFVENVMNDIERLNEHAIKIKEGHYGHLKIGFLKHVDFELLMDIFSHFQKHYPEIALHYKAYQKKELLALFASHQLDAIIMFDYSLLNTYPSLALKSYELYHYVHKECIDENLPVFYDTRHPLEDSEIESTLLRVSLKEGSAILHEFIQAHPVIHRIPLGIENQLRLYYHENNDCMNHFIKCTKEVI